MSVNTLVKGGVLSNINTPITILPISIPKMEVNYNPGLARDNKGRLWISIRSCVHNPKRWKGYEHPMHYQNFLHVGFLDEKTMKISELKEVKPEEEYKGFQWGIEDVRLFWRKDGMHGIGVIIPIEKGNYSARQAEILIDHKAGTYKLLKDWGRPFGHVEKNWAPPEEPSHLFDFIYSPTQTVLKGNVYGEDNELFIHNGTTLIKYRDGYLSFGHVVINVLGERTYGTVALKFNKAGKLREHSQFFHFNVGWRQGLKETIEFASGLVWCSGKEGKEMLVGLGVKDELAGIARLPIEKLRFEPYEDTMWYAWTWASPPNRIELKNAPTPDPAYHHTVLSRQPA